MPKRFYWLKLKDSFFKQLAIKKLRKVAGGDTFVIIYLKMMLLSINNEGKIVYELTNAEEFGENLALDIDEQEDNVNMTLAFLKTQKLIEFIADGEAFLPEVIGCIGSESESASRVRKHRESSKALQCNTNVTELSQKCNARDKREDIEKDIDISSSSTIAKDISKRDEDTENLFKDIEFTLKMPITPYLAEKFLALQEEVGYPALKEALEESAKHGARSYAYVETVARKIANGGNIKKGTGKLDFEAAMAEVVAEMEEKKNA